MNTKKINPKDAVGIGKIPMSCVPSGPLQELGVAMYEGARKYGRHNWRATGTQASVMYDAAMRHLMAWWEGEDIDPDSGLSHLTKAMASMAVLRDAQIRDHEDHPCYIDDRPPTTSRGHAKQLNLKALNILKTYPDAPEPITELGMDAEEPEGS